MQKSRANTRKIKNYLNKILNTIKFKIEAFSFSKIIILVGVIIGYSSLFMEYIHPIYSNIFNKITSVYAIIIILILTITLFLLFSYNKKEQIKKSSNILLRDYIIIIFLSIILLILSINNLGIILGLETFDSEIKYGNGIVMIILSSIFLFFGALLLKKEYKTSNNIYLNDSPEQKLEEIERKNTKLPF